MGCSACFISQRSSRRAPHQQNQSGLQAEHLAQPSRNSEYKHFRSYPKVSTSAQQDDRKIKRLHFLHQFWMQFRVLTILPTAMQFYVQTDEVCKLCSVKKEQQHNNASDSESDPSTDDVPCRLVSSCSSRIHKGILYLFSVFLLSFVFWMCISASPPSSLRFTYLHCLVGCVTGVILVGRLVFRSCVVAASCLYWVDTCGLIGRLFGGALVRVTTALGLDSGNLC